MAEGTGLTVWDCFSPRGISQYVQCILHTLTGVLLCVPFIFTDGDLVVARNDFLCIMEIVLIFHTGYIDYRGTGYITG